MSSTSLKMAVRTVTAVGSRIRSLSQEILGNDFGTGGVAVCFGNQHMCRSGGVERN